MTKARFAFYFLWFVQTAVFVVLIFLTARYPNNVHYAIFTGAGRYLLEGKNPYGVWEFGGLYFYSPVCGWFFGLLSYIPHSIGIFCFSVASHLVLLEGARQFLNLFPTSLKKNGYLCLLVILSTGELLGGYQAFKIEMLMVGMILITAAQCEKHPIAAGLLGALVTNFKWFPIAPLGLLALGLVRRKKFKFPAAYVGFLIFWFALPVLAYGPTKTIDLYRQQNYWLGRYIQENYLGFASVFGFLHRVFDWDIPLARGSFILMFFAGTSALAVWFARLTPPRLKAFAIALGCLWVVNFNWLSQYTGYSIATPALAYTLYLAFEETHWRAWIVRMGVAAYWILVSMVYSDLVPVFIRNASRHYLVKPIGSFVLMLALFAITRYAKKNREDGEPVPPLTTKGLRKEFGQAAPSPSGSA